MTPRLRTPQRAVRLALMTAVLMLPAVSSLGHKGHRSPSPSPSPSPSALPAAAGLPAGTPSPSAAPAPPESVRERLSWVDVALDHPHNKLVHFPLAFGLAAAVFFMVSGRWPGYVPAARALLLVAAVLAVGAYFTGESQAEAFENGPLEEVVEWHETLGKASGITLWAGVALAAWPPARRWLWLYGCLLVLVLAATGTLGGILSHTEL